MVRSVYEKRGGIQMWGDEKGFTFVKNPHGEEWKGKELTLVV